MAAACPRGQIMRRGYTTRRGVRVKPVCIRDRGKPGKGERLFVLRRGSLRKHGYSAKKSDVARHRALARAVRAEGYTPVIRKLNAVSILQMNTNPAVSKKMRRDMEYVQMRRDKYERG